MQKIFVLALPGCVGSAVLGIAEIFSLANKVSRQLGEAGPRFDPIIVGLSGEPVTSDEGMALQVTRKLPTAKKGDLLIVPGCMTSSLDLSAAVKSRGTEIAALKRWASAGGLIAAQCSAVFLLAEAGLLTGRKATATWWAQEQLKECYPDIHLSLDETLTDDDGIICAAGPYSHLDLGLHLIEKLTSRSLASLVAKFAMIERAPPSQSAFRTMDLMKTKPALAKRIERLVLKSLPNIPTVGDVASELGLTPRTLQRRLADATDMTPKALIDQIRMGVAKRLIETTAAPLPDLMLATGFADESAFRKQFARASGMTPKQYADRYAPNR
ncbi:helix-turn-helix domain-containing protein [Parvibaculaceae bacterium PLY_AMNH_Bact1]|nr:helix-turn-helix domain-containing protein [Parvibaculaceae bacterium PLY_AMNH_Bact1]